MLKLEAAVAPLEHQYRAAAFKELWERHKDEEESMFYELYRRCWAGHHVLEFGLALGALRDRPPPLPCIEVPHLNAAITALASAAGGGLTGASDDRIWDTLAQLRDPTVPRTAIQERIQRRLGLGPSTLLTAQGVMSALLEAAFEDGGCDLQYAANGLCNCPDHGNSWLKKAVLGPMTLVPAQQDVTIYDAIEAARIACLHTEAPCPGCPPGAARVPATVDVTVWPEILAVHPAIDVDLNDVVRVEIEGRVVVYDVAAAITTSTDGHSAAYARKGRGAAWHRCTNQVVTVASTVKLPRAGEELAVVLLRRCEDGVRAEREPSPATVVPSVMTLIAQRIPCATTPGLTGVDRRALETLETGNQLRAVAHIDGNDIQAASLATLSCRRKVEHTIVDAYCTLIARHQPVAKHQSSAEHQPRVCYLASHILNTLHDATKRSLKKPVHYVGNNVLDPRHFDLILVATLRDDTTWMLVVADMKKKRIEVFDPAGQQGAGPSTRAQSTASMVAAFLTRIFGTPLRPCIGEFDYNVDYGDWRTTYPPTPAAPKPLDSRARGGREHPPHG